MNSKLILTVVILVLVGVGIWWYMKKKKKGKKVKCINGTMSGGVCVCNSGWTGKDCSLHQSLPNPQPTKDCPPCKEKYVDSFTQNQPSKYHLRNDGDYSNYANSFVGGEPPADYESGSF